MSIRVVASNALELVFPHLDDKDLVWKELVKFTGDEDEYSRRTTADILSEVSL